MAWRLGCHLSGKLRVLIPALLMRDQQRSHLAQEV